MQPLLPLAAGHEAAGIFVDDHNGVVLHDVVLVPVIKEPGPQRSLDQLAPPGGVLERCAVEFRCGAFEPLETCRSELGLPVALIAGEVGSLFQSGRKAVGGLHGLDQGGVVHLPADDQGRDGLIDQEVVGLVDDHMVESAQDGAGGGGQGAAEVLPGDPATGILPGAEDETVAQEIREQLFAGRVNDAGGVVLGALAFRHLRQHPTRIEAAAAVEPPEVGRVAPGEVIVGREDVHRQLGPAERRGSQGNRQRLALARGHFGQGAVQQGKRPLELHGIGIKPEVTPGHLRHDGQGGGGLGETGVPMAPDLAAVRFKALVEGLAGKALERRMLGEETRRVRREIRPRERAPPPPADALVHPTIEPVVQGGRGHQAGANQFGGRIHATAGRVRLKSGSAAGAAGGSGATPAATAARFRW